MSWIDGVERGGITVLKSMWEKIFGIWNGPVIWKRLL